MSSTEILPSEDIVQTRFHEQYGDLRKHGWRVRMRYAFRYFEPDAWYEAVVDRLVSEQCFWIDVGSGKSILPQNKALAEALARRCAFLIGVDPDDGIAQNRLVHEHTRSMIEEYESAHTFDLATLRMVAEHIERPELAVASLARLIKPGGRVVIYTPNRWSPVSIVAAILPSNLHPPITRFLWQTKDEDVFPTVYKMNTRRDLRTLFESNGFKEVVFAYLANCTTFQRFRWSCYLELSLWRMLRTVGILYPENNLLGVYERE